MAQHRNRERDAAPREQSGRGTTGSRPGDARGSGAQPAAGRQKPATSRTESGAAGATRAADDAAWTAGAGTRQRDEEGKGGAPRALEQKASFYERAAARQARQWERYESRYGANREVVHRDDDRHRREGRGDARGQTHVSRGRERTPEPGGPGGTTLGYSHDTGYGVAHGYERDSSDRFAGAEGRGHDTEKVADRDVHDSARRGYQAFERGSSFGAYEQEQPAPSGRESPRRRTRWQREQVVAGEIMTRDPKCVTATAGVREVAEIMRAENCGIVPVVDEHGRLQGVVTDRDIVMRTLAEGRSPVEVRVSDVMTDDVEAVTADTPLRNVVDLMGERQIRRVPVVDREDRVVGIIAMADVANRADYDEDLQEALEEISARRSFWSKLWS